MEKHMFDKYFILDDSLKNVSKDGEIIGFQLSIKGCYYRGVSFSTIDGFSLVIDGNRIPDNDLFFELRGQKYTIENMEGNVADRWEFGEEAILFVKKDGGLSEGKHSVYVKEKIRIVNGMYIPEDIFTAECEKNMTVQRSREAEQGIKRGISLYSFQDELYLNKMNLEDCIRKSTELGAYGIEIISEATIPNFPNPSQDWIDNWFILLQKYNARAVCYDMFMDGQTYRGIDISEEEAVDILKKNIVLAAKLGFSIVRVVYTIPLSVIEKCLECAEKNKIIMGIEIHPPFKLKTAQVDQYVDFITRTNTKNFGLIPDFGIFVDSPIPVIEKFAIEDGARTEIVKQIHAMYENHMMKKDAYRELANDLNAIEEKLLNDIFGYTYTPPELLAEYMPYVVHVHGKVYFMDEDHDPSIDNKKLFNVLKKGNYSGYVCTEYEGQRLYHSRNENTDNIAVIRKHQEMMNYYINDLK